MVKIESLKKSIYSPYERQLRLAPQLQGALIALEGKKAVHLLKSYFTRPYSFEIRDRYGSTEAILVNMTGPTSSSWDWLQFQLEEKTIPGVKTALEKHIVRLVEWHEEWRKGYLSFYEFERVLGQHFMRGDEFSRERFDNTREALADYLLRAAIVVKSLEYTQLEAAK